MNIPKAIKVNEALLDGTYDHRDEDMEDALKLGLEALQIVLLLREGIDLAEGQLLPSETQE